MKKLSAFLIVMAIAGVAKADSIRPILVSKVLCAGTEGKKTVSVSITSTETTTSVKIEDGMAGPKIDKSAEEGLTVGDEGSVYIQQVTGEYNLILFGDDLGKILSKPATLKQTKLSGRLSLFAEKTELNLDCRADLQSGDQHGFGGLE